MEAPLVQETTGSEAPRTEITDEPALDISDHDPQAGVPARVQMELPVATIAKVFASILLAAAAYKLWSFFMLIFLAALVAVTLHPVVKWLEGKHVKSGVSHVLVITALVVAIGLCFALVIPAVFSQLGSLTKDIPHLRDEILGKFAPGGFVRQNLEMVVQDPGWAQTGTWIQHLISVSGAALGGVVQLLILIVIAAYLLIDGNNTYKWALVFFAPATRRKIHNTSEEVAQVIFGYVAGQALTSGLVVIYTFTVLVLLKVPVALPLAILAGIFDILPILGFFLSTAPACLLALSVSSKTAWLVLVCYVVYHLFENYLIVPKVYGKSLRLSTLTVLLGIMIGGILGGVLGALAVLPVIASYAVVERIWLQPYLGRGVSEKHEIQKDIEFGEKE